MTLKKRGYETLLKNLVAKSPQSQTLYRPMTNILLLLEYVQNENDQMNRT